MLQVLADPDELGQLYERCIRCLYLHYRGKKDVGAPGGGEWAGSIVGYHTESDWFELRNTPKFRFRSYGEMIESRSVSYPDLGVTIGYAGHYDALLELEDGTVALAKCLERASENAPKVHRWGLHGHAFALEHPRTARVESINVPALAVLEFKMTPAPGGMKKQVSPSRLSLFERHSQRFSNWMRVVARLLAGLTPPEVTCPVCARL